MLGPVSQLIESSFEGHVLRLILNNPPANALSLEVMETMQGALDEVREDRRVHVVVIAAAGKMFSAGHDLKEMTAHRSDADGGRSFFEQTFGTCSNLMQAIGMLPQPVIAEVDGIATAAGCQLAASCDLVYASDRARFGANGINVGLFCSTPAVPLTRSISMKHAMEMLLTGDLIDAQTALRMGLANRVVPPGDLRAAVNEAAAKIAAKSPSAIRLGKKVVREQAALGLPAAYECASRAIVENMLSPDAEEGIDAFFAKRTPKWVSG